MILEFPGKIPSGSKTEYKSRLLEKIDTLKFCQHLSWNIISLFDGILDIDQI